MISSLKNHQPTLPGHWNCLFVCHFNSTESIHSPAYRTHCHICPIRYSFTPESSETCEGEVPCPRAKHRNNVPILRRGKHDISQKTLRQVGFKTARQAATLAKLHAQTIATRPSLMTSREEKVVKSLAQFICGCFKQIICEKYKR